MRKITYEIRGWTPSICPYVDNEDGIINCKDYCSGDSTDKACITECRIKAHSTLGLVLKLFYVRLFYDYVEVTEIKRR